METLMTGKRFICLWPLLSKFPCHRKRLQKARIFVIPVLVLFWNDLDKAGQPFAFKVQIFLIQPPIYLLNLIHDFS
jgi:hypothetical protein